MANAEKIIVTFLIEVKPTSDGLHGTYKRKCELTDNSKRPLKLLIQKGFKQFENLLYNTEC